MADVRPFRGWRYNLGVTPDLAQVVAPPYDVINAEEQQRLHRQHPNNVVRLELGLPQPGDNDAENVYTRAVGLLRRWRADGVLAREERPAFYLVEEAFEVRGRQRARRSLYGAVTLEPWERGIVVPHEETTPGPKQDRMRLLKACQTNISPVMALYEDHGGLGGLLDEQARSREPLTGPFTVAGVTYRVWVLDDAASCSWVQRALRNERLYIADGHHRYETALTFRDQSGGSLPGASRVLMGLVGMEDPGLEVQSFHRVLSGLGQEQVEALRRRVRDAFDEEPVGAGGSLSERARALAARLDSAGEGTTVLGFLDASTPSAALLRLKPQAPLPPAPVPEFRECETWVLHQALLNPVLGADMLRHVAFPHGVDEVAHALESGEAQAAFLVRAIPLGVFRKLASKGQRLPPKTTYFYPKLPTGIVLRTLDE
ncbi:MAG: DUF1015 domain-containing protein [Dehalococcoidia bacterium]|nr:DUF1015 domain-containing protein [Dehalococcoidia bacterium]